VLNAALSQTFSIKQLEEAKSSLETILAKDYSEWTEDDAKAVALVYKNAVEEGNEDTLNKIINSCIVVSCDKSGQTLDTITYEYKVTTDTDKINAILSELDPISDVSTYNMLYRLGKYEVSGTRCLYKFKTYTTDDIIDDVNIKYSKDNNGINNIDLTLYNEVYSIDRLDFSNAKITDADVLELFGEEYTDELQNTFVYAENQTDVEFLTGLYNRNYRETTMIDPGFLSDSGKELFAMYANNLMAYVETVEDSDNNVIAFTEVEMFLNGILGNDEEKNIVYNTSFGKQYVEILKDKSSTIGVSTRISLFNTLTSDTDYDSIDEANEFMKETNVFCNFWEAVYEAISPTYLSNFDMLNSDGDASLYVNKIEYDKKNHKISASVGISSKNGKYMGMNYYNAGSGNENSDLDRAKNQKINISVSIIGGLEDIVNLENISNSNEAYQTMVTSKRNALFDMVFTSIPSEWLFATYGMKGIKTIGDAISSGTSSSSAWGSISSVPKALGGNVIDYKEETADKLSYLSTGGGLVSAELSFGDAIKTYKKKIKKIQNNIVAETYGYELVMDIGGNTTILDVGVYDAKTMVSLMEFDEKGIYGLVDDPSALEGKINEKFHYINDGSDQYNMYADEITRMCKYIDGSKVEQLSECIDRFLYGNDRDGDGISNYDCEIYEIDPIIATVAWMKIKEKLGLNRSDFIYKE
jgi:hypothetical protein